MTQKVIFISYSHKDEREKDKLLTHLGVLQHEGLVDMWSDDRIGAGSDWKREISEAMAQARVAILLISANFLTSAFILREEVPKLLKRRESDGLTIFPVIIKSCAWQEVGWLAQMNVRPRNGRPIWGAGTRRVDEDLATIAKEVASVVKTNSHITPTASGASVKSERDQMLREILTTNFSQGDLRDLCFDIGVDYESLPGRSKGDLARELIKYLERRGRTSELVEAVKRLRPNISWDDAPEGANIPEVPSQNAPGAVTASTHKRLKQKLQALQEEWDLRNEKIKQLRTALAIEAGVAVKFQLEQQILKEETELANLDNEIDQIEQALQ